MRPLIRWMARIVLAGAVLAIIYTVADHAANSNRLSLSRETGSLTFGAAPANGAGAEVCTYFTPTPSPLATSQLGQVRCGADQILLVNLQPWTTLIESGSTAAPPAAPFGASNCTPSPACGALIRSGAGVLSSIEWDSSTAMPSGTTLTCWNNSTAGTIDNQIVIVQQMSAGEMVPIPAGGWAFSNLFCQTNVFISTSQAFVFGVR